MTGHIKVLVITAFFVFMAFAIVTVGIQKLDTLKRKSYSNDL